MAGWWEENGYQPSDPTDTSGGLLPSPTGPQATTMPVPSGASSTSGPISAPAGNDPNAIKAWVIAKANATGHPEIAQNPDYWVQQIQKVGGVGDGQYWGERIASGGGGGDQPGGGGGFSGSGVGFGSFLTPYSGSAPSFNAPTGLNFMNDPGYQERLKMGTDALQSSAAAKGTLLTGGTLKDLAKFGQDYASNEFGNVFNRALQGHQADMGTFGANYDIFRNNQTDPFNKLYSLTGLGLNAASGANSAGSLYGNQVGNNASNYGNLATGYANNAGNMTTQLGNVGAAGIAGQYNAYGPAIGSVFDWYQKYQNRPRSLPELPVKSGFPTIGTPVSL